MATIYLDGRAPEKLNPRDYLIKTSPKAATMPNSSATNSQHKTPVLSETPAPTIPQYKPASSYLKGEPQALSTANIYSSAPLNLPQKLNESPDYLSKAKALGQSARGGLTEFNAGIAGVVKAADEWTAKNIFGGQTNNLLKPIYDYYLNENNKQQAAVQQEIQKGNLNPIVNELTQGTVGVIPTAALGLMTGGTSLGAQAGISAATAAPTTMQTAAAVSKELANNPQFWVSMTRSFGSSYNEATANGVDTNTAIRAALLQAVPESIIEVSGGTEKLMEQLASKTKGLGGEVLKSALEEGLEEILQYPFQGIAQKATYVPETPVFSTKEQAVINPLQQARAGLMGAGVGLIAGGGAKVINNGINVLPQMRQPTLPQAPLQQESNLPTAPLKEQPSLPQMPPRREGYLPLAPVKAEPALPNMAKIDTSTTTVPQGDILEQYAKVQPKADVDTVQSVTTLLKNQPVIMHGLKTDKTFDRAAYAKYKKSEITIPKIKSAAVQLIDQRRPKYGFTKEQWNENAYQIGAIAAKNNIDVEQAAHEIWFNYRPNQKGNFNRQGKGYTPFTVTEFVNAAKEGALKVNPELAFTKRWSEDVGGYEDFESFWFGHPNLDETEALQAFESEEKPGIIKTGSGIVSDTTDGLSSSASNTSPQNNNVNSTAPQSTQEVSELYGSIKEITKAKDKAMAKNSLTSNDNVQVDRLLKGEITIEQIANNANKDGVIEVYNAKRPIYERQKQIDEFNAQRKNILREKANDLTENSEQWKDKRIGLAYSRETMERNIRDIVPNPVEAEKIIDYYFTPIHQNEARAVKMKNDYRQRVKNLKLNSYESTYTQLYGELTNHEQNTRSSKSQKTAADLRYKANGLLSKHKDKIDLRKVKTAVAEFRTMYDELISTTNNILVANGYKPVDYRSGYFPHFTIKEPDSLINKAGKALGFDMMKDELPTDIAGLTHTFRPGKRWVGNFLKREGETTDYDAIEGFDRYIEGVADVINHTGDIQKLRDFENALRYKYSDEGTKEEINEVRNMQLTDEERQIKLDALYTRDITHFSHLVTELKSYTDTLANKKHANDRSIEADMGRGIYKLINAAEGRIAANMVAINPGSWLTNFIPLAQGSAELKVPSIVSAAGQTLIDWFSKDGFADKSTFLTNRRGSDPLTKTNIEKASEILSKPMYYIDNFTSNVLMRARVKDNMAKGMSEERAIYEADKWTAGLMADRSKGALPTFFNRKNPITKTFSMFQVEVNNQLSYLFKDLPKVAKDDGIKRFAWAMTKFMIGAFLYNEIYEKYIGRRPALDPIGMVKQIIEDFSNPNMKKSVALGNAAKNLAKELPFVGGVIGGGRLPISSALPNISRLAKLTDSNVSPQTKKGIVIDELAKPLFYMVMPFGGGQIKKAAEGIAFMNQGGSYKLDNNGNKLLEFPALKKKSLGNIAHASLFGKYANPEAQEWVKSGFKGYSAKQTAAYEILTESGMDAKKAFDSINTILDSDDKTAKSKMQELLVMPSTDEEKEILYRNLISDTESNTKKLSSFKKAGLNIDDYLAARIKYAEIDERYDEPAEKATAFYKWADKQYYTKEQYDTVTESFKYFQMFPASPEQYRVDLLSDSAQEKYAYPSVKKIISGEDYVKILPILSEVEASKDEFGNAIAGTAKPKEIDSIAAELGISTAKATDIYNEIIVFDHELTDMTSKQQAAYRDAVKGRSYAGEKISEQQYIDYSNSLKLVQGEKDSDGKTISGSLKRNRYNTLRQNGMSDSWAQWILFNLYSYKPPYS